MSIDGLIYTQLSPYQLRKFPPTVTVSSSLRQSRSNDCSYVESQLEHRRHHAHSIRLFSVGGECIHTGLQKSLTTEKSFFQRHQSRFYWSSLMEKIPRLYLSTFLFSICDRCKCNP